MKFISREYAVAVAKRNGTDPRIQKFQVLKNGLNYWVADPFPIEIDGQLYIFGEVFVYSKLKGCIGYTKLVNGKFSPWKIVIEEKYHMSFPYLFYKNDNLYMCPEVCASKQLYLYRCIKFPEVWIKDKVLIQNANLSDTIFYHKDQDIFGITCIWDSLNKHEIKIFKVDKNGCTFSNEKLNTEKFYLTRPAGKIFKDNKGKDILVSQICKPKYGSGLIFKEFILNWPNYSEHEIDRIYPKEIHCDTPRNYVGMHTYNLTLNYMVIDLIWERIYQIEKKFRVLKKIKKDFLFTRRIDV